MKKIFYGLSNIRLAPLTEATADGVTTGTYGDPVSFPGAVNLTLDVNASDADPFYADDGVYYLPASSSQGYTGSLEMARILEDIKKKFLDYVEDENGLLVELSESTEKYFALLYEYQTNDGPVRGVFYKCRFSRPSESHATNTDTTTPGTESIDLTVLPTAEKFTQGTKSVSAIHAQCDENSSAYADFFKAVVKPSFETSGEG